MSNLHTRRPIAATTSLLASLLAAFVVALTIVLTLGLTGKVDSATAAPTSAEAKAATLPSKQQWLRDVNEAMAGAGRWLDRRVDHARGEKLAINLDIDNSSLASHYDRGAAIARVLRFTRHAHRHGVAILFNTARSNAKLNAARRELTRAGYRVDGLCGRTSSREDIAHSKQRCRALYQRQGYTIVGNVGNRPTDFTGSGYERAFRLPNYAMRLS